MKIAIKNFLTTLRRYKVASVLNIAGMTLAFLAFYVIMSQVYYNITYNRPIKDSDRTYILLTRFAEAEVEWHGERWLVAMPLNPSAMPRIERTVSALRKLNTGYLAECRILPGEMRWHDATGTERHTDLVLQHLPAGREFAEALLAEDTATLLAALDT